MSETFKVRAIGESTSCGHYNGSDHKEDADACIPLMVKNSVVQQGIQCDMDNQAVSSTTVDWSLGRKDGDESEWEPELITTPPGTLIELSKSTAHAVTIQLGINDAVFTSTDEFYNDFQDLVDNCKKTGKVVFLAMPNIITDGNQDKLAIIAQHIETIGNDRGVTLVNSGIQIVQLYDDYHPVPGVNGYIKLGSDLSCSVSQAAANIMDSTQAVRYYIAMFNRTPEKSGLDYWTNELSVYGKEYVASSIIYATEAYEGSAMTDAEFINRIYNNLLGRTPDDEGFAYWINQIQAKGRGVVMNDIIYVLANGESTSGQSKIDEDTFRNKSFVGMAYGKVYGVSTIAADGNLSSVTNDPTSVYTTISFICEGH